MATLGRPARPVFAPMRRAYRLEMAGRTAALLLGMLALTGLVIFYLGVLAGKGLRDPNQPAAEPAPAAPAAQSAPAPAPTALNEALTAQTGRVEGLKSEESAASQQTQQLLTQAKQQLDMEELPAKPAAPAAGTAAQSAAQRDLPAPAQAAPRKKAPSAAANPASPDPAAHQGGPAADAQGAYTVQVFSSPQQQSAQEILSELKRKGFPAYLNQFQAADNRTWYRVRVGKGSRQEAENLAVRLRRHSTLHGMRVLKL